MPAPERPPIKAEQEQDPVLELPERLRLKEQYLAQVKVLYQSGILENFLSTAEHPLPEMGVIGIDGKEYILPSYEDILKRLQNPEAKELMEKKADQGFTKLQIIPFALPLSVLIDRYKQVLLKINKESGLKATDGSKLELDENNPVYVWENLLQCDNPDGPKDRQMEYGVANYDGQTKEQRGGKYKSELLNDDPDNGWHIALIEDNPDLPADNKGRTIAGRKQIEANQTPKQYLKSLQKDPQYQGGPAKPLNQP
jgi:hypothetical protein